jgi:undecaprenyl-diphosphatase
LISAAAGNHDRVTATDRSVPPHAGAAPVRVRRLGVRAALAAAGVLVAVVPVTLLAVLVRTHSGTLRSIDEGVAGAAHRFVVDKPALREALGIGSVVLHPRVMWGVAGVTAVVLWRRGKRRWALWAVVTVAVGGGIDTPLKEIVARARPVFDVPVATAPGFSFPSGHALNAMLIGAGAVVLGWRGTRGRPAARALLLGGATTLVVVTGLDRVGLGVHYTSDVVGGWLIGLATVLVTTAAFHTDVAPEERDPGEPPSTDDSTSTPPAPAHSDGSDGSANPERTSP